MAPVAAVRPLLVAGAVLLLALAGWQVHEQQSADTASRAPAPVASTLPSAAPSRVAPPFPVPAAGTVAAVPATSTVVPARVDAKGPALAVPAAARDFDAERAVGVATAAPAGMLERRLMQNGYVNADEAEGLLMTKDFAKTMRDVQADPQASAQNAMAYRAAFERAMREAKSAHRVRDVACSSNLCIIRVDLGASDALGDWYGAESIRVRLPMPSMTYVVAGLPGGGYEARVLFSTDPGIAGGFSGGLCDARCQAARQARRRAVHDGTQG